MAYATSGLGGVVLSQKASNGAGSEETLLASNGALRDLDDWSRDRKFLSLRVNAKTKSDLWVLPMTPDKPGEARKPGVYLNSESNEAEGRFSPDGHWIAHCGFG